MGHLPSPSCLPYPSSPHLHPPPHPASSRPNAIGQRPAPGASAASAHLSHWYKFPPISHGLAQLTVGLGLSPGPGVLFLALAGPQVLLDVALRPWKPGSGLTHLWGPSPHAPRCLRLHPPSSSQAPITLTHLSPTWSVSPGGLPILGSGQADVNGGVLCVVRVRRVTTEGQRPVGRDEREMVSPQLTSE